MQTALDTRGTLAHPRELTVKETAHALRVALRTAFPRVKFSVRMSTGTGHGWLKVKWTDGPSRDDVMMVCDAFESSRFNSMTDGYDRVRNLVDVPGLGWCKPSCRGINETRKFSEAAQRAAADIVAKHFGIAVPPRSEWINTNVDGERFSTHVYRASHHPENYPC